MTALLERLEGAREGSVSLNGAIQRVLFPDALIMTDPGSVGMVKRDAVFQPLKDVAHLDDDVIADCTGVPAYTTSIDAALALAERVLPGCGVGLCSVGSGKWEAWIGGRGAYLTSYPTPALAICAAILRATDHAN